MAVGTIPTQDPVPPSYKRDIADLRDQINQLWKMVSLKSGVTAVSIDSSYSSDGGTTGSSGGGGGSLTADYPVGLSTSAAVGVDPYASHSDHVHPATVDGNNILTTVAVTNNAGVSLSGNTATITNSLTPVFTSATVNGAITTGTLTTAASGVGYLSISAGDSTHSAFVNFFSAGGVRQGYIGYSTSTAAADQGTIPYSAGTHQFVGAMTVGSTLNVTGVITGGSVTGTTSVNTASLQVSGAAGVVRDLIFQTAGVARWVVRAEGTAESGSNVGSDFQIIRRDDAGASLGFPLVISRSTGTVTLAGPVTVSSGFTAAGTSTFTGSVSMTASNANIEIGSTSSANTPYLDFHSSGNNIDYDTRIIASGGSASVGQGTLSYTAAIHSFSNALTVNTGNILASNGSLVAKSNVASTGFITVHQGDTGASGYLEFVGTAGTRQGYLGYSGTNASNDAGTLNYVAATHAFNGAAQVSGNLLVNSGKQVYYDNIGAAAGVRGTDVRYDVITGASGAGVGNIAAETITGWNILDESITSRELSYATVATRTVSTGAVGDSPRTMLRYVTGPAAANNTSDKDGTGQYVSRLTTTAIGPTADGYAFGDYCYQAIAGTTANGTQVLGGPLYGSQTGETGLKPGNYVATVYARYVGTGTASANIASVAMSGTNVTSRAADLFTPAMMGSQGYVGLSIPLTITGSTNPTDLSFSVNYQSASGYSLYISHVTIAPVNAALGAAYVSGTFERRTAIVDAEILTASVSKLIAGTINTDDIYLGVGGHIYAGNKTGGRVELNAAGLQAYQTVNLLTNNSLQSGTTNWAARWFGSGGTGTNTQPTSGGYDGTTFWRKTWTSTQTAANSQDTGIQFQVAATAGTTYTYSMWVRSNIAQIVTPFVQWLDAAFSGTSTSGIGITANQVTLVPNTWTRISFTATCPAGSANAWYIVGAYNGSIIGWTSGDTFDADAGQAEVGTVATIFTTNTSSSATTFTLASNGILTATNPTGSKIVLDPHTGLQFYATNGTTKMLDLDIVTGGATFAGALSAASGTFAGALSAATGTFAGVVSGTMVVGSTAPNQFQVDSAGKHWSGTSAFPASASVAKFAVDNAGVMWATAAVITGAITATSGYIGGTSGWAISSTSIASTNATPLTLDSTLGKISSGVTTATVAMQAGVGFWAGATAISTPAPFSVTNAGVLTATSGTVGGWALGAATLTGTNVTLDSGGTVKVGTGANTVGMTQASGLWAGLSAYSTSAPFYVTTAGALTAVGASLSSAVITGSSLTVGATTHKGVIDTSGDVWFGAVQPFGYNASTGVCTTTLLSSTGGTLTADTYYYYAQPVDSNGTPGYVNPASPVGLVTTGTTSQITVTWTNSTLGTTRYDTTAGTIRVIRRKASDTTNYAIIATGLASNATTVTDSGGAGTALPISGQYNLTLPGFFFDGSAASGSGSFYINAPTTQLSNSVYLTGGVSSFSTGASGQRVTMKGAVNLAGAVLFYSGDANETTAGSVIQTIQGTGTAARLLTTLYGARTIGSTSAGFLTASKSQNGTTYPNTYAEMSADTLGFFGISTVQSGAWSFSATSPVSISGQLDTYSDVLSHGNVKIYDSGQRGEFFNSTLNIASATFVNGGTAGPDAHFYTGLTTSALVWFSAWAFNSAGSYAVISPALYNSNSSRTLGSLVTAASDNNGATFAPLTAGNVSIMGMHHFTGLATNSWYIARMQYRNGTGTATFDRRKIYAQASFGDVQV